MRQPRPVPGAKYPAERKPSTGHVAAGFGQRAAETIDSAAARRSRRDADPPQAQGSRLMPMQEHAIEQVLVVPTALFHDLGWFQGFQPDAARYLETLLDPAYTSYRPRPEMELDPGFKQLIPYCIFRCGEEVFFYRRGKLQGEGRLRSKRSIGIGGHVSTLDKGGVGSVYREGMQREIAEEIHLETGFRETCLGLINDDETEVGRVHLGIVHLFELEAPKVRPREESIQESGFASPAELIRDFDGFETWSQICLQHLVAQRGPARIG